MSTNKKYGLLLPDRTKLQKPVFQASRNVFGNDSDSEDESKNKKPILLRPSDNINRQAKITQEKAIVEDPTVYQYDEIYEDLTNKKEEKNLKSKEDKKPRYIENLIKSANKRKIENERRIERQIQKEREKEGDEFADKEVFVTSAYKKKLEELRLEEEKEKHEEYLESIGDVTKQRDLDGFYRHLYEQKLGFSKNSEVKNKQNTEQTEKTKGEVNTLLTGEPTTKKRNYRKRKLSSDNQKHLSEGEIEDSDEEINHFNLEDIRMAKKSKQSEENIDADSDFTIDESSEGENIDHKNTDTKQSSSKEVFKQPATIHEKEKECKQKTDPKNAELSLNPSVQVVVTEETKTKVDIWKKRTIGEVFENALKRYYQRKAERGA